MTAVRAWPVEQRLFSIRCISRKEAFWGVSRVDCMEEFCEVEVGKKQYLIGMCILIRARLKFGGCALWRPVAPVNV